MRKAPGNVGVTRLYAQSLVLRTWARAEKPMLPYALRRQYDVVKRTLGRISENPGSHSVSALRWQLIRTMAYRTSEIRGLRLKSERYSSQRPHLTLAFYSSDRLALL